MTSKEQELEKTLQKAKQVIKDIIDGWHVLPTGSYSPSVIQYWILKDVNPPIQRGIDFLKELE